MRRSPMSAPIRRPPDRSTARSWKRSSVHAHLSGVDDRPATAGRRRCGWMMSPNFSTGSRRRTVSWRCAKATDRAMVSVTVTVICALSGTEAGRLFSTIAPVWDTELDRFPRRPLPLGRHGRRRPTNHVFLLYFMVLNGQKIKTRGWSAFADQDGEGERE